MEGKMKKGKDFRFDKRWIKDDTFLMRVSKIWCQNTTGKDSLEIFTKKLKSVKKDLKGWGANMRGQIIQKKRA